MRQRYKIESDRWLKTTHMEDDESYAHCPVCEHPFYSHFSRYTDLPNYGRRIQYDAAPCYQEIWDEKNKWQMCRCMYLRDCIGEEH